jgi:quercetin dioxygenase-like cupin family protein
MPHIAAADAPIFTLPGTTFTGLAAPSRGARENAVWRVALEPGTLPRAHQLTREEILIATSGAAIASLNGEEIHFAAGDALIIPAFAAFSLANPGQSTFEAVAVLPVGARAWMEDGELFVPPWSL